MRPLIGLFSLSKLGPGKERKRRGWFHRRTGVAQYLPGCILQAVAASLARLANKASGSITLLPSELLHAIFELLALSDRNTLSNCMQVCRRWHDIARLHFFAVVPVGYYYGDHFSQLLCTDPGLARHIKEVHFMDEWGEEINRKRYSRCNRVPAGSKHPFDIRLLSSTLPTLRLVNLQHLSLVGFDNLHHNSSSQPPAIHQSSAQGQNNPSQIVSLRQLTCDECLGLTLILPALLSLFSVDTLVVRVHPYEPSGPPWDMLTIDGFVIPPASITIQNLVFNGAGIRPDAELGYYEFFERILVPGSLRTLGARAKDLCSYEPQLARFLRCDAARNLLSISVDASDLMQSPIATDGFKILGAALAHCTRLECFRIRFIHGPCTAWYNHCRDPHIFAHILANLSGALRVFAIHVDVHEWQSWKEFRASAAGLKYVDYVLSPPLAPRGARGSGTRFPHLERVELNVFEGPAKGWQVRKPRCISEPPSPTPMRRLKAAGLLRLRIVREGADLPEHTKSAAFFLPLEVA